MFEHESFEKRYKDGLPITLQELMYPIMQGYDSVMIKADIELGGTDQKFNLLIARKVQRFFNQPEQDIITLPLLEGTDGIKKMSKSYGNYIAFLDSPFEMFSKIIKINDNLIEKYFNLLLDLKPPKLENPKDKKIILGQEIVKFFYDEKTALKTKEKWQKIFSKKEIVNDLPILEIKQKEILLIDLLILTQLKSKNEAKRLITQNAVEINQIIKNNPFEIIKLQNGDIIKIGKKIFFKIKILN
jgi:tyrosyl-tRNA synthetase